MLFHAGLGEPGHGEGWLVCALAGRWQGSSAGNYREGVCPAAALF
jgi:hypothetical protein